MFHHGIKRAEEKNPLFGPQLQDLKNLPANWNYNFSLKFSTNWWIKL